jgi:hypothetical protein
MTWLNPSSVSASAAGTALTVEEELRRYALDQSMRVSPAGTLMADIIKGATEIEAYLRGPTTETPT